MSARLTIRFAPEVLTQLRHLAPQQGQPLSVLILQQLQTMDEPAEVAAATGPHAPAAADSGTPMLALVADDPTLEVL